MNIAETSTFAVGKFTVRQSVRPDNPFFPCYSVFLCAVFIGKQFSYPSASDCEWLQRNGGVYVAPKDRYVFAYGYSSKRPGRPRKTTTAPTD